MICITLIITSVVQMESGEINVRDIYPDFGCKCQRLEIL